jgi:hypothetical protein
VLYKGYELESVLLCGYVDTVCGCLGSLLRRGRRLQA